jgi:hypothetical protein
VQEVVAEDVEEHDVMEQEDKHWTDDPELLERFVLHRLNPSERNELEDHVRICEVCKRAVRAEQLLIAGIRRSGREHLKRQIKTRIAGVSSSATPWRHIISAAALIVIITGVGIYNRWFEALEPSENVIVHIPPDTAGSVTNETAQRSVPGKAEKPAAVSPPLAHDRSSKDGRRNIAAQGETRREPAKSAKETGLALEEIPTTANRTQGQHAQQGTVDALATTAPATEEIWLEGTILPSAREAEGDEDGQREKARAMPMNKYGAGKEQPQARAKSHRTDETLIVRQEQTRQLPETQRQMQQLKRSVIMTKAERMNGTTQLTLYLDSTLDESALATVTAETVDRDSLILHLPNQRVGYKLPPGWNTPLPLKQAK